MPYLDLLKNHIDITHLPFSDRDSRLLVFQTPGQSRLYVKLADRLTGIEPGIESYRTRPPFIKDVCLVDGYGVPLAFQVASTPYQLTFHTRLGDFALAFQDQRTLSWRIPPGVRAGLSFHVSPQYWAQTLDGGTFKSVRNVTYHANGKIVHNQITPEEGGYKVVFIVEARRDSTITLSVYPELSQSGDFLP